MWGFSPDDLGGPPVQVWPENQKSVNVFIALGTQWRFGGMGPTGLDYNVLAEVWQRLRIRPRFRNQIFSDLRWLESAALGQMRDNTKG